MNDEPLFYPDLRSDSAESVEDHVDDTNAGYYTTTSNPASLAPQSPGVDPAVLYYHTPDQPSITTNTVLVAVLIALIFLFVVVLVYLLIPLVMERIQAKLASSQRRIQRRYETIEGWLISKKVRAHCAICEQLQQQYKINHTNDSIATTTKLVLSREVTPPKATTTDPNRNVQLSPSYDTAETEPMPDVEDDYFQHHHECPICYEALAAGDIVSWSPQNGKSCSHVFHHECIKEWLLHHDTCPCCRIIFLPIDQSLHSNNYNNSLDDGDRDTTIVGYINNSSNSNNKTSAHWGSKSSQRKRQLQNWVEQRSQRIKTTYYCLQEGFVTLDSAVPKDGDASTQKSRRFVGSGISPTVLAQLRKSRSSLTTVIATTPNSTTRDATDIHLEDQPFHHHSHNNNANNSAQATNESNSMHRSSSPMAMLINRCHSAPSSTNSTAAPRPMWTSRPDGSWVGTVDLDLCMQQLRVLGGMQDLSLRSSSDEEEADDELYLESPSTASSSGGSSFVSSASSLAPQPLHMSNVVVGDIELCMVKQQQQQNHEQHQRPIDWESASF